MQLSGEKFPSGKLARGQYSGGIHLGDNYLGYNYPGGQFSWGQLDNYPRGKLSGRSYLDVNFPWRQLSSKAIVWRAIIIQRAIVLGEIFLEGNCPAIVFNFSSICSRDVFDPVKCKVRGFFVTAFHYCLLISHSTFCNVSRR